MENHAFKGTPQFQVKRKRTQNPSSSSLNPSQRAYSQHLVSRSLEYHDQQLPPSIHIHQLFSQSTEIVAEFHSECDASQHVLILPTCLHYHMIKIGRIPYLNDIHAAINITQSIRWKGFEVKGKRTRLFWRKVKLENGIEYYDVIRETVPAAARALSISALSCREEELSS